MKYTNQKQVSWLMKYSWIFNMICFKYIKFYLKKISRQIHDFFLQKWMGGGGGGGGYMLVIISEQNELTANKIIY